MTDNLRADNLRDRIAKVLYMWYAEDIPYSLIKTLGSSRPTL